MENTYPLVYTYYLKKDPSSDASEDIITRARSFVSKFPNNRKYIVIHGLSPQEISTLRRLDFETIDLAHLVANSPLTDEYIANVQRILFNPSIDIYIRVDLTRLLLVMFYVQSGCIISDMDILRNYDDIKTFIEGANLVGKIIHDDVSFVYIPTELSPPNSIGEFKQNLLSRIQKHIRYLSLRTDMLAGIILKVCVWIEYFIFESDVYGDYTNIAVKNKVYHRAIKAYCEVMKIDVSDDSSDLDDSTTDSDDSDDSSAEISKISIVDYISDFNKLVDDGRILLGRNPENTEFVIDLLSVNEWRNLRVFTLTKFSSAILDDFDMDDLINDLEDRISDILGRQYVDGMQYAPLAMYALVSLATTRLNILPQAELDLARRHVQYQKSSQDPLSEEIYLMVYQYADANSVNSIRMCSFASGYAYLNALEKELIPVIGLGPVDSQQNPRRIIGSEVGWWNAVDYSSMAELQSWKHIQYINPGIVSILHNWNNYFDQVNIGVFQESITIGSRCVCYDTSDNYITRLVKTSPKNLYWLKEFNLRNLDSLARIGNQFLHNSANLTVLKLEGLKSLEMIGDNVLQGSVSITEVILYNLTSLKSIGRFFGGLCIQLEYVELRDLPKLESLDGFLSGCIRLRDIKLINLPAIKTLGTDFCCGCRDMVRITLEDFPQLLFIDSNFMMSCQNLKEITVQNLPKLGYIRDNFVYGNHSLKTINLINLPSLQSLGPNFAKNCAALKTVNCAGLDSLQTLSRSTCEATRSLKTFPFESIPKLKYIQTESFWISLNLREVRLVGLQVLEMIENSCFSDCNNLSEFVLSDLPALYRIQQRVLYNSTVDTVILKNLPNLRTIGEKFMEGCDVTSVSFIELPSLISFGDGVLYDSRVQSLTIDNFSSLVTMGKGFCKYCRYLSNISIDNMPSLTTIDNDSFCDMSTFTNLKIFNTPNLTSIDPTTFRGIETLVYKTNSATMDAHINTLNITKIKSKSTSLEN